MIRKVHPQIISGPAFPRRHTQSEGGRSFPRHLSNSLSENITGGGGMEPSIGTSFRSLMVLPQLFLEKAREIRAAFPWCQKQTSLWSRREGSR